MNPHWLLRWSRATALDKWHRAKVSRCGHSAVPIWEADYHSPGLGFKPFHRCWLMLTLQFLGLLAVRHTCSLLSKVKACPELRRAERTHYWPHNTAQCNWASAPFATQHSAMQQSEHIFCYTTRRDATVQTHFSLHNAMQLSEHISRYTTQRIATELMHLSLHNTTQLSYCISHYTTYCNWAIESLATQHNATKLLYLSLHSTM